MDSIHFVHRVHKTLTTSGILKLEEKYILSPFVVSVFRFEKRIESMNSFNRW